MPHLNQLPKFKFPTALRAFVQYGRYGGNVVLDALQHAYDSHMERAQMRLAPGRSRSWRDIPRAGAHHACY